MAGVRQKKPFVKVILLGDSGVGKTSLMRQYVSNRFEPRYKATIGADFCNKEIDIDGNAVSLQIWDTAGQERFQSLGTAFYRGADACVLVFDITNAESFSHLTSWLDEFSLQSSKGREVVLVGNKADLQEKRQVFQRGINEWCGSHGNPGGGGGFRGEEEEEDGRSIPYFEASAKTSTSVADAFLTVAKGAFRKKLEKSENVAMAGSVGPVWSLSSQRTIEQQKKKEKKGCGCSK